MFDVFCAASVQAAHGNNVKACFFKLLANRKLNVFIEVEQ